MARATYAELGDACATAHAMELIGGRWCYPILRELVLGPKRFGELLGSVRGITPAVLTSRLRELSAVGLVGLAGPGEHSYALTDWALELAPILRDLGRWAQASPVRTMAGGLTPDAAVQAMITMADGVSPGHPIRVQLGLVDDRVVGSPGHAYRIEWSRAGLRAERGHLVDPAATVHCDSSAWGRVLFTGESLGHSGATTTGDAAEVDALVGAFRAR